MQPTHTSHDSAERQPQEKLASPAKAAFGNYEAFAPLCSIFRRYLKGCGQKFTLERAYILDAIIRKDEIFEVEELLDEMKAVGERVSKATVYRTIRLLQDAGIIQQVLFDRKQAHYQLIFGREPKDHLSCVNTGRIIEFSCPELIELRDRVCAEHGWKPVGHRFQIFAECPGSSPMPAVSDDA
ncbi:MAG: transcriptional repressor [Phycisphaerales bacterium]|nr:transcriptional repressor [Phycisphaerales bacterium]